MGFLRKFCLRLLCFLLPNHGKRAIFLTTLFLEISKISPSHREVLIKLNNQLKIVDDVQAFGVPIYLHDIVWSGRHISVDHMEERDIDGICHRILRDMPALTHYSSEEKVMTEMRSTIQAALENREVSYA